MMGDPYFIKGLVVPDPFWPDYNVNNITKFLAKISEKTNLKWFRAIDGVLYIHSINYKVHNKGIVRNLGPDKMPSYSNEPTPIISGSAPIASPGEDAGSGTPGTITALYVPGVLPKPLITFAGEWKGITEAHMTLWAAKYPLVDVEAKLDDLGAAISVVTKQQIVYGLSALDADFSENAVEVYIYRLRKRLEGSGTAIQTVRGFGYLLDLEVAPA